MNAEQMHIDETDYEDVVVLSVRGMLASQPNLAALCDRLNQLKQGGRTQVVVDCSRLVGCGAALLGWFVTGQKALREAGGDLYLAGLSDRMRRIMALTQLSDHFSIFTTAERAVDQAHGSSWVHAA
jgi:anti-sigma B factor antagonist